MRSEKLIFHIDVNSAFLSWSALERLRGQPGSLDLRTVPSAVGGVFDVASFYRLFESFFFLIVKRFDFFV